MLRKILKVGLIGTAVLTASTLVLPDQFTPIQKVVNVGTVGAQLFYVYKYKTDKTTE